MKKQVSADHYKFEHYLTMKRWSSIWHQIHQVQDLRAETVLELGPGPGTFKVIAEHLGVHVETFDIDPDLKPDHLGDAQDMMFENNTFDIVCAFQMLEHLEYSKALKVLSEMARVAKEHVVVSLPDSRVLWKYSFYLPRLGQRTVFLPRPFLKKRVHSFDGEHHWEINKHGYDLEKIIADFSQATNGQLVRTYRVHENTYHRFFVFKKSR